MTRSKPFTDSMEDVAQDNIFISGDRYEEEKQLLHEMMMEYMEERKAVIKTEKEPTENEVVYIQFNEE